METRICILLVVLGLLIAWAHPVQGAVVAQAQAEEGAVILLTDEPCKLDVKLSHRALWKDKKKTYEGCAGVHPAGIVILYFDDKSLALIPLQAFQRVSAI